MHAQLPAIHGLDDFDCTVAENGFGGGNGPRLDVKCLCGLGF